MNQELADLVNTRPGALQKDIEAFYGKFKYAESLSPHGSIIIEKGWSESNLVTLNSTDLPGFPFANPYHATRLTCHKKVARPLVLTWKFLIEQKLDKLAKSFDGMWVARHQLWNPSNPLSVHSFGAAIDTNVFMFPYGTPLKKIPQEYLEFYEAFEQCGWTWGGRWTPTDVMHLQWTDPVPNTSRGLTPLIGETSDKIVGNKLFVNGAFLGEIDKQTEVGSKLYITTKNDV